MDIPTPPDGNATQRLRRPVPPSLKIAVPMTVLATLCIGALGWAWSIDKAQALDHQRLESVERGHAALQVDMKGDLREIRQKLDELRDIVQRDRSYDSRDVLRAK